MNDLQRGVLLLVKSAITGEKYALPEGFDFAQACADVKHHHMVMWHLKPVQHFKSVWRKPGTSGTTMRYILYMMS